MTLPLPFTLNTAPRDQRTKSVCPLGPSTLEAQKGLPCYSERIQNYLAAQKHSLEQKKGHHHQEVPLDCPLLFLTLLPLRCLGTAALTTLAGAECSVGTRERGLCTARWRGPPPAPHSHHHSHSSKYPAVSQGRMTRWTVEGHVLKHQQFYQPLSKEIMESELMETIGSYNSRNLTLRWEGSHSPVPFSKKGAEAGEGKAMAD